MVQSKAATVQAYLDQLPDERREVVSAVRDTILKNLPDGYVETMNWGMISYEIPLHQYPDTYNGQPLGYVALAAQKNYYSLYLSCMDEGSDQELLLKRGFEKAGRKLNMGRSCIRFRKLDDIPLDVIAEVVAYFPPDALIERYEQSRNG